MKAFPLRSGAIQRCPLSPLLLNKVLEVLAMTIIRRKENKRNPNWKRRSKTVTVCRCHDTINKKPKDVTRKLLELINEFGKVTEYKVNIQKSAEKLKKQFHLPSHQKE